MDRLREKSELLIKLGALFGPLQRLVSHPHEYGDQQRAQTIARYSADYPGLIADFFRFSEGQPGHSYRVEAYKFENALNQIEQQLAFGSRELIDLVPSGLAQALAAIDAIPVPQDSVILEPGTPFSTYCRLRTLCEVDATASVVWLDAYMDASVFHRFLAGVRQSAHITIVTMAPKPQSGNRDKRRWTAFLDISRLFANERGPGSYRLVVHDNLLHDRWLMFDSKRIYSLGGSAKDAGNQAFTISSVESTIKNLQEIQKHVDGGEEYFGPSTLGHR